MAEFFLNKCFKSDSLTRELDKLIKETIENDDFDALYLIVPTGRLVRKLKQRTIRAYYQRWKKPLQKVKFFTFQKLVDYCFEIVYSGNQFRKISDAYMLTLFEEASETATMSFYKREGRKLTPAVLTRLASIVYGLKEDGISHIEMLEEANLSIENQTEVTDVDKFSDIANLYSEYQNKLGDTLIDPAEELNLINELFEKVNLESGQNIFDQVFKPNQKLLFYGFSDFKTPEIRFISNFADTKVEAAVIIDYHKDNGPLFGNFEDAKQMLFDSGFIYKPDSEIEELIEKKDMEKILLRDYLRRWLFSPETEIRNSKFADKISIISTQDRYDEVDSISKLIKHLSAYEGIRPHQICVAFKQPDIYSPLFREAFYLNKIAANITDRYKLDRSPVTVALFSMLNIITKGYGREDINKALHSSFLRFDYLSGEGESRIINGTNIYETALKLRITGGSKRCSYDYWKKRLDSVIFREESNLQSMLADPEAEDMELYSRKRDIEKLHLALEDITALKNLLPDSAKLHTPEEFAFLVKQGVIGRFKLRESIEEMYDILTSKSQSMNHWEYEQLMEEIEKYSRALASIIEIIDEMAMILGERFENKKFKLVDLVERFKTAITGAKFQVREKANTGVTVTSIEQTRGLEFKVLILCGAIDGEFPIGYKPESFLGKELSSSEKKHIQSERMQYYQFLTNSDIDGETKYFIFYPKFDGNDELVRSPFVDALLKVTELESQGKLYDLPELRRTAANDPDFILPLPWINIVSSGLDAAYYSGKALFEKKIGGADNSALNNAILGINDEDSEYIKSLINSGLSRSELFQIDTSSMTEAEQSAIKIAKKQAYSVSSLEVYASCPYKYFSSKGLGFQEKLNEEAALTPLEKGTLLHAILYEFYNELKKDSKVMFEGITFVRLSASMKDSYLDLLKDIGEKLIERYEHDHAYFMVDKDELFGLDGRNGILEMWLNCELNRVEEGWGYYPALFETSFGMKSSANKSSSEPLQLSENLKLRGKIDRIEILGQNGELYYLVADYKTNLKSAKSNTEIEKGKAFQMPLYILATQKILREKYGIEATPDGSVYYGLRPSFSDEKSESHQFALLRREPAGLDESLVPLRSPSKVLKKGVELEDCLKNSVEQAEGVIEGISEGRFSAKMKKEPDCAFCNFSELCRLRVRSVVDVEEETESISE